jgi:hypothetical protein
MKMVGEDHDRLDRERPLAARRAEGAALCSDVIHKHP